MRRKELFYYVPSASNVMCDANWCVTVFYQRIKNGNIANQIHGFTTDYGKYILINIITSETMKRRPCWCTKAILWELTSFPMHTLSLGLCFIFFAQKSRPATWNHVFPPLIYSAESSLSFGRREKCTHHAAKLQLSVRTKSHTHFVNTCLEGF